MFRGNHSTLRAIVALTVLLSLRLGGALTLPVGAQATFTTVATNLDNPRGLSFAPDGTLYVAEAGKGGNGPCRQGPEGGEECYGASGAITRVLSGTTETVLEGLPSLAGQTGDRAGGNATGPHDVAVLANGDIYATVGWGGPPNARAALTSQALGTVGENFGLLWHFDAGGQVLGTVDIAAFEQQANPDGTPGPDSNAYGLAALSDRVFVADAGGNTLLDLEPTGPLTVTGGLRPTREMTVTDVITFPTRLVPISPTLSIPMQAVPNSVTIGPDGAAYVGQLTGFPFPVGGAEVFRIDADGTREVYADGFTNIIDLTFDADGNLYVLELVSKGLGQEQGANFDPSGALIRVAPNKTKTTIASAGLVFPGGVAISPAGGIYVTNFSVAAGGGQVVRINTCVAGSANCQEPRAPEAPLTAPASGAQEVDSAGAPNKGDTDGSGSAIVTVNPATRSVCIQMVVENVQLPLTLAHIHQAPRGTNGGVKVNFTNLINGNVISGCTPNVDQATVDLLLNDPAQFYVNVHNTPFPAGAVRGQLANGDLGTFAVALPLVVK